MLSRQNGEFRRSVISALAAMVAAAVPTLVPSAALAEKNPDKTEVVTAGKESKAPAKAAKKSKKATASKAQKPAKKADKAAKLSKPAEADAKLESKANASASKGKKAKKTASRSAGAKKKTAKKADSEAPRRACLGTPITIDRGGLETQTLALVDCRDRPIAASGEALSILARPWGAARPPAERGAAATAAKTRAPRHNRNALGEIAPGVRLLDKGLLVRVAAIAKRFGNRPISLVSGYRPQSRGSLHQAARALDLRVAGVGNEELVAFCKTLKDTGCGYYPNSSFIHVDVRSPGTGTVSWIDTSGPGESPHYVARWPLPPEESDAAVLPDRATPDAADPYADDDEHAPHGKPGS